MTAEWDPLNKVVGTARTIMPGSFRFGRAGEMEVDLDTTRSALGRKYLLLSGPGKLTSFSSRDLRRAAENLSTLADVLDEMNADLHKETKK